MSNAPKLKLKSNGAAPPAAPDKKQPVPTPDVHELASMLERAGVDSGCIRCKDRRWTINVMAKMYAPMEQGGDFISLPVAVLICVGCGWAAEHSLGALTSRKDKPLVIVP